MRRLPSQENSETPTQRLNCTPAAREKLPQALYRARPNSTARQRTQPETRRMRGGMRCPDCLRKVKKFISARIKIYIWGTNNLAFSPSALMVPEMPTYRGAE